MSEIYNRYNENLNIDCECNKPLPKVKEKSNCCCEGGLPSHSNEIEILVRQLKREVKDLMTTTEAKLLCQDKKIAEMVTYIKNNLSNAIRTLLDTMIQTHEIDDIITSVLEDYNQISLLGVKFNSNIIANDDTFEDIKYLETEYIKNNGIEDFEITNNGIVVKSTSKNNLLVNLNSIVRDDSQVSGSKYIKIEIWRNGILVNSDYTFASCNNEVINLNLSSYFKVRFNDLIKIKIFGKKDDNFLLTRINAHLSMEYNID